MHKLYIWHPQRSIESQSPPPPLPRETWRMDGMAGRRLLIERKRRGSLSWTWLTEREGWGEAEEGREKEEGGS